MNRNLLAPYVRVAARDSVISAPVFINDRCLYDYELIAVSSGKCRIVIDGVPYLCGKDDLVWLPPGVQHRFEDADGSSFGQPHLHFDAVYSELSHRRTVSFQSREQMTEEEQALIQEDVFRECEIPYVFRPQDPQMFRKVFYEVVDLFERRHSEYELLCRAKMLELLAMILRQFAPEGNGDNPAENDSVSAVKNYLDNNFLRNITLEMLEKQFYINKYTLLRRFRRLYGKNVMEYCRELRLGYAKQALRFSNISVRSLGEMLGYGDAYSFSRVFKQYTGMSPREYRDRQTRE